MLTPRGKHARPARQIISGLGAVTTVVLATTLGLTSAGGASAATETVTEGNLGVDWFQEDQRGTGAIAFTNAYGAPAGLGSGSLQLTSVTSEDKANLYNYDAAGTSLSAVTELSYWTYRSADSTEPLNIATPSFQLQVDFNGAATGGFSTLVYEPYLDQGNDAVQTGVWQQWDVDSGKLWSSRAYTEGEFIVDAGAGGCPCYSVADLAAAFPEAVVLGIGVNVGSGNTGYVVAADGLTINGTTYDFETAASAKEACKGDGWETNYAIFVNQGDCVSYFASNGKTHGEQ